MALPKTQNPISGTQSVTTKLTHDAQLHMIIIQFKITRENDLQCLGPTQKSQRILHCHWNTLI